MDVDGSILIRCNNGVKGIIRASQIATGENNNFTVMIYGKKGGLKWGQENPRVLYFMQEGKEVEILESDNRVDLENKLVSLCIKNLQNDLRNILNSKLILIEQNNNQGLVWYSQPQRTINFLIWNKPTHLYHQQKEFETFGGPETVPLRIVCFIHMNMFFIIYFTVLLSQ